MDLEFLGVSRVSLIYSQCWSPVLHFTALLDVVPLNTEVNPPTEVRLAELAACLKRILDETSRADGLLLAPQRLLFNLCRGHSVLSHSRHCTGFIEVIKLTARPRRV